MKVINETSTRDFEFWSGAKNTYENLKELYQIGYDIWDDIDNYFEQEYPDGIGETELNDLFWFDPEFIYEIAGFDKDEDGNFIDADGNVVIDNNDNVVAE